MPYYIRKKSESTWTHGSSEIIISSGYFRLYLVSGTWVFELTEDAGSDNIRQNLPDIILVDETTGSTEETFTDGVVFANRLKALAYPFFKSASGGSGAVDSVFGRTGAVTAQNDDYTFSQLADVTFVAPTNGQVLTYNSVSGEWENQDSQGGTGGNAEFQTTITAPATVFDGTQEGQDKIWDFKSDQAMTLQINAGDYTANDVVMINATSPQFKFIQGTGFRIRGTSNVAGEFILTGQDQPAILKFRSDAEAVLWGSQEGGFVGAVTITSYSAGLAEGAVAEDIDVVGFNFNPDMVITTNTNAILNSWTYVDSENITLNLTANSLEGSPVDITYDNSVVFTDTNAITIGGSTNYIYSTDPFEAGYAYFKLRDTQVYGITVRRSSDDAETDVEFNGNDKIRLDSTVSAGGTLTAWAGSDDVFVTKKWNQGSLGTDYDLVQTNVLKQELFLSAGALIVQDTWIMSSTDSRTCEYKTALQRDWDNGVFTMFAGTRKNIVGTQEIMGISNGSNQASRLYHFNNGFRFTVAGTTATNLTVTAGINIDTNYRITCVRTTTNQEGYIDEVSVGTAIPPSDNKTVDMNIHTSTFNTNANPLDGYWAYSLLYEVDKTTNIASIGTKILASLT